MLSLFFFFLPAEICIFRTMPLWTSLNLKSDIIKGYYLHKIEVAYLALNEYVT